MDCTETSVLFWNLFFDNRHIVLFNFLVDVFFCDCKWLPTKSANTWEVDAKGDLNEDKGEKTSELGFKGGGGGQLGGDQGGGQEEDGGEEKTLMVNMMMTIIMMMVMKVVGVASWEPIRVEMRKKIVESRRPQS